MNYLERQRKRRWIESASARQSRAMHAEWGGYPTDVMARYILGSGACPWIGFGFRQNKNAGVAATTTGAIVAEGAE